MSTQPGEAKVPRLRIDVPRVGPSTAFVDIEIDGHTHTLAAADATVLAVGILDKVKLAGEAADRIDAATAAVDATSGPDYNGNTSAAEPAQKGGQP